METIVQIFINALSMGLTYVLMALGLTLIFSIMGIVNFAHGEIYMIGAFAAFVFTVELGINYFLSLFLTVLTVSVIGIIIERGLFRKFRGAELNGLVLAVALSILLQNLALIIFGGEDRSFSSPLQGSSLTIWSSAVSVERLVAMGVSMISLVCLYLFINRTKTGQAMRAMAQDSEAAALQGININYISAVSFGTGCALAALAGGLLAPIYFVSPFIGGMPVLKAFIVVVLGGLGSIPGALAGGLILGCIDSIAAYYLGTIGDLFGFVLLMLFIIFKPTGLFGYE